ncbi:MAG: hypothetical protein N3A71_02480 [Candidatus Dojkabacteria bacterium]|nr:hypothetical protein [Candidatus Dojkabacteria bacterium]
MIRLDKRPKLPFLGAKMYWSVIDFCCKYFGTYISIKTNKKLKKKYIIRKYTNTIHAIDGEIEVGEDPNDKSSIKHTKKETQVPEIRIIINHKHFDFVNLFDLSIKLVDVYGSWYRQHVNVESKVNILCNKYLREIYFLCKSLEYFYKTNEVLIHNVHIKKLKNTITGVLSTCDENGISFEIDTTEILDLLQRHLFFNHKSEQSEISPSVIIQRLKYLLSNLYLKIEHLLQSIIFEIACLEVERLTDLHKLLAIFEKNYANGRSIKEYIQLINREKDPIKKSELEMKACQLLVDFLRCSHFFVYEREIFDIGEIYHTRRMNCTGIALMTYILLNRYLDVEHCIVQTYHHLSNIVRLSNDYLAYLDESVFLVKDQRKNEYLRRSKLTRWTYVIDPVPNSTLAYCLSIEGDNHIYYFHSFVWEYYVSKRRLNREQRIFVAKELLRSMPNSPMDIINFVAGYLKQIKLVKYKLNLSIKEKHIIERFYKSWIRISVRRNWGYMFMYRCAGLSHFYYIIGEKDKSFYYANLVMNLYKYDMSSCTDAYYDNEVEKRKMIENSLWLVRESIKTDVQNRQVDLPEIT